MKQDLHIGSAPSKEPYTHIETLEDYWRAWHECQALIEQLHRKVNWVPGCELQAVFDKHSSSQHMAVICTFMSEHRHHVEYARKLEAATPDCWDIAAKRYLTSNEVALPIEMKHSRQRIASWKWRQAMDGKFSLGHVTTTEMALREMIVACQDPMVLLQRHVHADWGDVGDEYKSRNDQALIRDDDLLCNYVLSTDGEVWIVTNADRSLTMFLLPQEYCS